VHLLRCSDDRWNNTFRMPGREVSLSLYFG
jgi:hypothetical protein